MRVYVSAAWADRAEAQRWMARLRAAGHAVEVDWTRESAAITRADRERVALRDVRGIENADLVWQLAPGARGRGARGEMLGAVMLRRRAGRPRVVVSGPPAVRAWDVFTELADEQHDTHEAAFASICRVRG